MIIRRPHLRIYGADTCFRVCRILQSKGTEWYVDQVTTYITQRASAIIPPAAPVEWMKVWRVRFVLRRTEPEIPIQILRLFALVCRGHGKTLWPHRAIGPDLYF